MLIVNRIGGGGSFAKRHPFDVEGNCVLVGHDGPHNIAVSGGKSVLRKLIEYHGKSGSGIGVEFSLKAGPVTMMSINCRPNGRFRLIAAAGRIPRTDNTRVVIPNRDVADFIARWREAGPTHHLAPGTGNRLAEIRAFARIMNLDLTAVE